MNPTSPIKASIIYGQTIFMCNSWPLPSAEIKDAQCKSEVNNDTQSLINTSAPSLDLAQNACYPTWGQSCSIFHETKRVHNSGCLAWGTSLASALNVWLKEGNPKVVRCSGFSICRHHSMSGLCTCYCFVILVWFVQAKSKTEHGDVCLNCSVSTLVQRLWNVTKGCRSECILLCSWYSVSSKESNDPFPMTFDLCWI